MKVNTKKFFEAAGIDTTNSKVKQLIETHATYYVAQFVVGRSCKLVEDFGQFSTFENAVAVIKEQIKTQFTDFDEDEGKVVDELMSIAEDVNEHEPNFTTIHGEFWDIGTDQISFIIGRNVKPTCDTIAG